MLTSLCILSRNDFHHGLLGSNQSDHGNGITLDGSGNAFVTGFTNAADFPTTPSGFQKNYGGIIDGFVCKLNSGGSALIYSTHLGGSDVDEGSRVAVDASGNAYVTGVTVSSNFPITPGAFQTN